MNTPTATAPPGEGTGPTGCGSRAFTRRRAVHGPGPFPRSVPPDRPRPCPRAFTLLEVMLAVVVASIVLMAINGVFFGALRLRQRTTDALERALPRERAFDAIKRDLAAIVPPGGTLTGTLQTSSSNTPLQGQVGPEFFTASATVDDYQPWAEIQRVAYVLLESTNGAPGLDLYRAVRRNLLPYALDEMPEMEWLLGGVEEAVFYFYDGSQWRTSWDSPTETTPLPSAIKLELQFAPDDPRDRFPDPVQIVVPLFVQAPAASTNATDESSSGGGPGGAP